MSGLQDSNTGNNGPADGTLPGTNADGRLDLEQTNQTSQTANTTCNLGNLPVLPTSTPADALTLNQLQNTGNVSLSSMASNNPFMPQHSSFLATNMSDLVKLETEYQNANANVNANSITNNNLLAANMVNMANSSVSGLGSMWGNFSGLGGQAVSQPALSGLSLMNLQKQNNSVGSIETSMSITGSSTKPNFASTSSKNGRTSAACRNLTVSAGNINMGQNSSSTTNSKNGQTDPLNQAQNHAQNGLNHNPTNPDEYRRKREKNNIAVRKSRAKAKRRRQELQHRLVELAQESHNKNRTILALQSELDCLRNFIKAFPDLQPYLNGQVSLPNSNGQKQDISAALNPGSGASINNSVNVNLLGYPGQGGAALGAGFDPSFANFVGPLNGNPFGLDPSLNLNQN